jgi:hypothetical protein
MSGAKERPAAIAAKHILDYLIALSDDKIWASELAFFAGARRIDFWTLEVATSKGFRTTSYEIKVSRSDFMRDSDEKQSGALRWSDRFWYVTPPGIIGKQDLPPWAGLMEFDGAALRVVRKAPRLQKAEPTWDLLVSILRNSGDCRRDVGLMKAQIAYFRMREEQEKAYRVLANRRQFDRFMRRGKAVTA